MIELRTGLPRNGKTLSMVVELAAMLERWDKHPEEARAVFCHNFKDLALAHAKMPYRELKHGKSESVVIEPLWDEMPDGSLVIIDEAQDCFPPRSTATQAPPHVAFLNKHGHRGFDIVVITQGPKLLDFSLRALVGKHKHYRRMLGSSGAVCYEWDSCSDQLQYKGAVKSTFLYPKKAFTYYTSAVQHNKQKFKMPLWMCLPFIGIAGCIYAFPMAYNALTGNKPSKPAATAQAASAPHMPSATPPANGGTAAVQPASAGGQIAPPAPVRVAKVYGGCISSATKCQCLNGDGVLEDNPPLCNISSKQFGGLVNLNLAPQAGTYTPKGASVTPTQTQTSTQTQTDQGGAKIDMIKSEPPKSRL